MIKRILDFLQIRKDRLEFTKHILMGLCAVLFVYFSRYYLVSLIIPNDPWIVPRYTGLAMGLGAAIVAYILCDFKWLPAWITIAGTGVIYALGVNGSSIFVPQGEYWDTKMLWYYFMDKLDDQHAHYAYATSVAYVSMIGYGLALVGGFMTLMIVERQLKELKKNYAHKGTNRYRSRETVFGDADWGNWDKIKNTVSDPSGLVLGEHYDPRQSKHIFNIKDPKTWGQGGKAPLITMSTDFEGGHSIIFAGTGGGKTAGVVYPTMLTYRHPIIVVDAQKEIFEAMNKARQIMGFDARIIERWNGIDLIDMMRPYFLKSDLAYVHLADSLAAPRDAQNSDAGRYFTSEASTLIAGLLKHIVESGSKKVFSELLAFISMPEAEFKELIDEITSNEETSDVARQMLASYKQMESKTFTALQSTVKQALKWANFEELNSVLSKDDGNQPPLLGPKTDVYIRLSLEDIKSFPTIIREILGTILYMINEQPDGVERLMIVDEAYQIGKMKTFETVRDTMRKRGLHLMQIFQSTGQIEELYTRAGVKAWRNSTAAMIYSSVADYKEAEEVSQMIGQYTVDIQGQSKSTSIRGMGAGSPTSSASESSSLQQARLIRPEQIRTLPNDAFIIFFKGLSPIVCGKAYSFRRIEWQKYTAYVPKAE